MNPREICERYEKLYTGAVADILDEKGYRQSVFGKGVPSHSSAAARGRVCLPSLG